jgi:hypothetical protein
MSDAIELTRGRLRALAVSTSWGQLAASLGIPKATLWRFCQDSYDPKKPSIRLALGLPVDPVPQAEPRLCACRCGQSFYPATWNQRRIRGHRRKRWPRTAATPSEDSES